MDEGEVKLFQCEVSNVCLQSNELHMCIHYQEEHGEQYTSAMDTFLRDTNQSYEDSIVKYTDIKLIRNSIYIAVLSDDDEPRNSNFKSYIQNGSTIYCVFGSSHDCHSFNNYLLASFRRYFIKPKMTTTVSGTPLSTVGI